MFPALRSALRVPFSIRFMSADGISVKFPAMSPTMTEGRIVTWRKKEGDKVSPGDALFEIQTDKATLDVEATEEGFLAKILMPASESVIKVGDLVAVMVDSKDDIANVKVPASKPAEVPKVATQPAKPAAEVKPATDTTTAATNAAAAAPVSDHKQESNVVFPSVRRLLSAYNIQSSSIKGTGPAGRITKGDVLVYVSSKKLTELSPEQIKAAASLAHPPSKQTQPTSTLKAPQQSQPLVEKVLGAPSSLSKRDIPHLSASIECSYDELLDTHKTVNELVGDEKGVPLESFIVKAIGLALRQVPEMNVHYDAASETWTQRNSACDVELISLNSDDRASKIVRKVDALDLTSISKTIKGQSEANSSVSAPVSLAVYDSLEVLHSEHIVRAPSVASVSVGSAYEVVESSKPTFFDVDADEADTSDEVNTLSADEVKVSNKVQLTLSWDARLVDEQTASRFLAVVKDFIQSPSSMLLK